MQPFIMILRIKVHLESMVLQEKKITMIYAITNQKLQRLQSLQRFIFLSNVDSEFCLGQGF